MMKVYVTFDENANYFGTFKDEETVAKKLAEYYSTYGNYNVTKVEDYNIFRVDYTYQYVDDESVFEDRVIYFHYMIEEVQ